MFYILFVNMLLLDLSTMTEFTAVAIITTSCLEKEFAAVITGCSMGTSLCIRFPVLSERLLLLEILFHIIARIMMAKCTAIAIRTAPSPKKMPTAGLTD
jgi:hypothetical protein